MKTSQLFRWIVAVVGAGAGLSLALYAQPGFGFGPDRQEIKLV